MCAEVVQKSRLVMQAAIKTYLHLRFSKHFLCFGFVLLFLWSQNPSQTDRLVFFPTETSEDIEKIESEREEGSNVCSLSKGKKIIKKTPPPLVLADIPRNVTFGKDILVILGKQESASIYLPNFSRVIQRYIAYHALIFYEC